MRPLGGKAIAYETPLDRMVGETIRDARVAKGWTQFQLADHAGVARGTVARLERGEGNTTLSLAATVLDALGYRLAVEVDFQGGML